MSSKTRCLDTKTRIIQQIILTSKYCQYIVLKPTVNERLDFSLMHQGQLVNNNSNKMNNRKHDK